MAKKKRRKAGRRKTDKISGWMHMTAGLAIGLAVAYGIYVSDRRQPPMPTPLAAEAEPAQAPQEVVEVIPPESATAITFDFYDMLPNLDVDLYDNAAAPKPQNQLQAVVAKPPKPPVPVPVPAPSKPKAVPAPLAITAPTATPTPATAPIAAAPVAEKPGIYILQAGSFSVLEVAQTRRAEMMELGVNAEIKRGSVNGKTVYRVYTYPLNNPQDVNRVRTLLIGVGIDILQKRVSD
jgi:cell division protein FtsN